MGDCGDTSMPHADVCAAPAAALVLCLEKTYPTVNGKDKAAPAQLRAACAAATGELERCVAAWRAADGGAHAATRVKGDAPGIPPPQCQRMACAFENCMQRTGYTGTQCREVLAHFKRCTNLLYLSEYVD